MLSFPSRPVAGAILMAVTGLGWAQPAATTTPASPSRPNIILILADDLGYGDLGCYGQTRIKTPQIDQLAAGGMRFTDFYAGSTVCAPSRCALMTGLHTGHAFVRGNAKQGLRPQDVTLAEMLQREGYHTGLVGKWGLGNEHTTGTPRQKGFREFGGYLDQTHAHDYYTDHLWRYDFRSGEERLVHLIENGGGRRGLYIPDLFVTSADNFLKFARPNQGNGYQPFFLYLALTLPHANNEEGNRTGNGMQVPTDAPYSAEAWPPPERNKAAMITRLDDAVGRVRSKLKELRVEANTVIFFSSDNGPHKEGGVDPRFFRSSGPLRGIKRDLYEGGIRVPLIVSWPGRIQPGSVVTQPWAMWDLLPTVTAIAGVNTPDKLDGVSFLPTLLGQTQTNHHEFFYWEFHERGFKQAVRMGDWKAVRLGVGQPLELYNLASDLAETNNVASDNPKVVAQIEKYLETARTESEAWPIRKAQSRDATPASPPR